MAIEKMQTNSSETLIPHKTRRKLKSPTTTTTTTIIKGQQIENVVYDKTQTQWKRVLNLTTDHAT
jgi:hypothetical protein